MFVCQCGHYEGLSRCQLVGRCVLPGENCFTYNKIASRCGAPQASMHMIDVGTETALRLDQRKHFRKDFKAGPP